MKYTNKKIEMAWMLANQVLARYRFPGSEGLRLFRFRRAAEPIAQFMSEEREKLLRQYHAEKQENGLAKFENEEQCAAYIRERDELENMETEMEMCPLRLRMPEEIELMQGDWEIMDGIIELYEEEPEITVGPIRILDETEVPDEAK